MTIIKIQGYYINIEHITHAYLWHHSSTGRPAISVQFVSGVSIILSAETDVEAHNILNDIFMDFINE